MVNVTIDGAPYAVREDQNVLEGALKAGVYIPHLCHHPDLPDVHTCRMCVVEVDGEVKPACGTFPKEGMQIVTKTERLQKLRSLALDLLLACHPEDCSTCPKYGRCELQTLIQYMGGASKCMRHRTKGFAPDERNPLLVHDRNRCVLCGRCVRACKDLRGVGVLDYQKKGLEPYVGALHDKLLIDADCRFCEACAEVCPTGAIRDVLQMAHPETPKEDVVVPCRAACPAHTDVPRYIRFVKEGKFDEAAAVIREKVPFPKVLGYICNHVCELSCKRGEVSEAMSIRNIKRFAAEQDTGKYWKGKGKHLPATGKTVCVVGAGPAGMTAAYYLQKQGHAVTVKEAMPAPGGMLRYGIPAYRLPKDVLDSECEVIRQEGVRFDCGTRIEKPLELLKDYDAVLLALGTHQGVRLPLPGADLPGVLVNTDFLRAASTGTAKIGRRVVVLGGGPVAFDCARTAKRLGAEAVHLACLEAREAMTADDEEIEEAQQEGIVIHPAKTFERITGDTCATGVDFMSVQAFHFDENHRAIVEKEPGSEPHIAADTVIFATGQRVDLSADAGLTLGRGNSIVVGADSLATDKPGLFAAGDAVYGTKSVIEAIASGRKAAMEIDRFLGGDGDISETLAPVETPDGKIGKIEGFGKEPREMPQLAEAKARTKDFSLVDHGFCADAACKEAGRCLQCDLRLQIHAPRLWDAYQTQEARK